MTSSTARNGSVEIAYRVEGPTDGTPLLLIMGLGLQMLFWPETFRRLLIDRGFRVASFDNRDVGLSTHLTGHGIASPKVMLTRTPGYGLPDMAEDAVAVLDGLGWLTAHVAGVSLGGMIAQTLAVRHPDRVRTLTSLSSTPAPHIGRPRPRALPALLSGTAHNPEQAAAHMVRIFRTIGSPAYPLDEPWLRDVARRSFERAHDPGGVRRQLAAIVLATDRRPLLRRLRMPALVVHGDADPLVRLSGGLATARAIPGARFVVLPGMGHDLPGPLQPVIADELAAVAASWSPG
ncbi:alpha/beta fold hydrolase [Paractinoplanes brasiliensis]|uniref:Pimeloyl-ACP methyl ester carboxylesterase n=1 Tax=Paractinoplanes brasiliensis TaxID=52695 RepID=A0A4R6JK88_9ACTN|nr:alpha/beta hydrolase [Actinoplanes brasiliensis]TDO36663.1 pimeloyl-ACP methyl ester carboxylesterase [Actinoplanes brasiliensis]